MTAENYKFGYYMYFLLCYGLSLLWKICLFFTE